MESLAGVTKVAAAADKISDAVADTAAHFVKKLYIFLLFEKFSKKKCVMNPNEDETIVEGDIVIVRGFVGLKSLGVLLTGRFENLKEEYLNYDISSKTF